MKAITFQGIETLGVEEVAEPELIEGSDVVVRVAVAGICGSDLHPYFGRETGIDVGTVMGHELVGEVVEVGADVTRWALGDRVVAPFTTCCGACAYCQSGLTARCTRGQLFGWVEAGRGLHGAQAEFVRVPLADSTLVAVPEGLDEAVALMSGDILSTATFGADLAEVGDGDVVAVIGCGPVGLLAVLAAFHRGASAVVAVDRVPSRLETAERFGAVAVSFADSDPRAVVDELTGGRGADAAIEAVGSASASRAAADLLRHGGRIAALGVHTEPTLAISPGEMYDRNFKYAAGRCPARHYMPASLQLAEREAALIETLISHRLPLDQGVEAYRRFAAREPGWNKVVLLPGD
ncbi:MAG: alcohol dehydrogenase catalytic domain-containing protein [Gemmatimonadetes bacterium]|nr:alcohol dehydrogenase catalytic domain-containing protein [Gemmatimonadota bacterium]NNF14768.1 alcohol dehydrogenase catalytic domain-containing protein [Gemmatimonadota bacterium]